MEGSRFCCYPCDRPCSSLHDPVYSQLQPISQPEKIKNQILHVLKVEGAQTATTLAEHLGVSPMAVRQHLQGLKHKHWVTYDEHRQAVGRPVKYWRLTGDAQILFPSNHEDLAVSLIQSAEQVLGPQGLNELIRHRADKQLQKYQAAMANVTDWRDRTTIIAQLRTQEGYMAEVIEQSDDSLLLVENNCSICAAAQSCPQLCVSELDVFSTLLGEEVSIERTEHILGGDRRCAYLIHQK